MEEKRRLQDNLEKVASSVPEMREEKELLAKERDKLERELGRQRYLARELQDQVSIFNSLDQAAFANCLQTHTQGSSGSMIFIQ